MKKNALKILIVGILTLIFILLKQSNTYAQQVECIDSEDCGAVCDGKCAASCVWGTTHRVPIYRTCSCSSLVTSCACAWSQYCEENPFQTCTYVSDYEIQVLDSTCYWDKWCVDLYCGYSGCNLWSEWMPCQSNCWSWRWCITGTYMLDYKWCCGGDAPNVTPTPPAFEPECEATMPENISLALGTSSTLTVDVLTIIGIISEVNFSSNDINIATVNPVSDPNTPYNTTVIAGELLESTNITANVVMLGETRCSDSTNVTITPPGPWWQVKDADIFSAGNITSTIPSSCSLPICNPSFDLDGLGTFPGIPFYATFINLRLGGEISSKNWNVNSIFDSLKTYSYAYFAKQIETDTQVTTIPHALVEGSLFESEGVFSNGAYWYKFDNSSGESLTINSDVNVGSRKVILLVDGSNLYINGKINLTDGEGLFMTIVGESTQGNNGNIFINENIGDSSSPEIEGLYFADNQIFTGIGNKQLHVRGSLAGLEGIILQRDLDDNTETPSEFIEFAPDQLFLIPNNLRQRNLYWKEVQP